MKDFFSLKEIKVILFDIDDTLFDRSKSQSKILKLIIKDLRDIFSGLSYNKIYNAFILSDRILNDHIEKGKFIKDARLERSKIFLELLDIDKKYTEEISHLYLHYYYKSIIPIKYAKKVIKKLSRVLKIGIVSNGFFDIQYYKLEAMGIKDFFDCIILSDEVGIRKPNPKIFLKAAEYLNINTCNCLYVGDSYEYDIIGSKKAGMKSCWLNRKNIRLNHMYLKPDIEIKRLSELLQLFKKFGYVNNDSV